MIAIWMVLGAIIGALVAGSAWAAEGLLRMSRLPTRWIWGVAMVGTVALVVSAQTRRELQPIDVTGSWSGWHSTKSWPTLASPP
jgi:hypothetical protein